MKVIAKVTEGRFLVEATSDELAQVMGFHSDYYIKDDIKKPRVGCEILVTKLWAALTVERGRVDEIRNQANALRKTADRLDTINAALDCPIVEPQS
jgi:predicted P-loop ATPase/GTPase